MLDIIVRPIVSEKNTRCSEKKNEWAFEVHKNANKQQIHDAIEKHFGVKVVRVNTLVCRREKKRSRVPRSVQKSRQLWKKAWVKLAEGSRLEFAGA